MGTSSAAAPPTAAAAGWPPLGLSGSAFAACSVVPGIANADSGCTVLGDAIAGTAPESRITLREKTKG